MPKDLHTLSKDLVVAREIYILEGRGETPVYFTKLVDRLTDQGLASRATVSRAVDMLIDQGIVKARWVRLDRKHVRALSVAGEAHAFLRRVVEDYPPAG